MTDTLADKNRALQSQLRSALKTVDELRAEVRRLNAALAVERAAQASKELEKARRDRHVYDFRISRLMRVFDVLDLPRPNLNVEPSQFANDSFLDDVEKAMRSKKRTSQEPSKDAQPTNGAIAHKEKSGQGRESPFKRARSAPQNNEVIEISDDPDDPSDAMPIVSASRPRQSARAPVSNTPRGAASDAATAQPVTVQPNGVLPQTGPSGGVASVDEGNAAAECLRLLIGAQSISVHTDPLRIKITMINPERNRNASFWLSWKGDQMEYTRESLNVEESLCPDFLKEYAIEFEIAQAPNFLVLLMGAMYDMKVEPKSEPEMEEYVEEEGFQSVQ